MLRPAAPGRAARLGMAARRPQGLGPARRRPGPRAGRAGAAAGPSGAGKSTLLAALAGLPDPETAGESEGELLVDGSRPATCGCARGLVLQDPETQIVMARAGDDVAFGLENRAFPADRIWPRVSGRWSTVGFPYGLDRSTSELSGGEKQRLAIAGVLALRPGLLLLDEPTANLDPAGAELVRAALSAVLGGARCTTILVEHRVERGAAAGGPGRGPRGRRRCAWPTVHRRRCSPSTRETLTAQGVWLPGGSRRPTPGRLRRPVTSWSRRAGRLPLSRRCWPTGRRRST